MILTCPQCSTRFAISADILGEEGKTVRCSKCSETWFQAPEEEIENDFVAEIEDIAEAEPKRIAEQEVDIPADIPEGVKPIVEPDTEDDEDAEDKGDPNPLKGAIAGYAVAFLIFMVSIALLIVFKEQLVAVWPKMQNFYALIGVK